MGVNTALSPCLFTLNGLSDLLIANGQTKDPAFMKQFHHRAHPRADTDILIDFIQIHNFTPYFFKHYIRHLLRCLPSGLSTWKFWLKFYLHFSPVLGTVSSFYNF